MNDFPYLGRVHNSMTTMKDSTFESKAYGKRVNKIISIEGRVQFDLFQVGRDLLNLIYAPGDLLHNNNYSN